MREKYWKLDITAVMISIFGTFLCEGIAVTIFFMEKRMDYFSLVKTFFIILICYLFTMQVIFSLHNLKVKFNESDEIHDIKLHLKAIQQTNITRIINKIIVITIFILFTSYMGIEFWGTKEIDKPFNRNNYEAIYEANLSKNLSFNNIERINVNIIVSNPFFSKKEIKLRYFQDNKGIEFDFSDEGPNLILGRYVPIEFYDYDDYEKEYKWYVELSSEKVSER